MDNLQPAKATQMQGFMDAMKQRGNSKQELYTFAKASLSLLQNEFEKLSLCSVRIEENRVNRRQKSALILNKIAGSQLSLASSQKTYHFPAAVPMKKCLSKHPLLDSAYYHEKGATEVISELASKRFADSEKIEAGVEIEATLLVHDLMSGVDGYTGKPLPYLGKKMTNNSWMALRIDTEIAIIDCAEKVVIGD
ncbi:MAG: hypothetical protein H0W50_09135 [Parachlamydiaceae bacterium]|nr:hypothetical protein [Parachlamydiaceae bacterium]